MQKRFQPMRPGSRYFLRASQSTIRRMQRRKLQTVSMFHSLNLLAPGGKLEPQPVV
jgi:hypothetical protein